MHLNLVIHNPLVVHFSQLPQHFCRRFLFLCGHRSSSSAFCLVFHQPCNAGTNTYPRLCNRFTFVELALGRMPTFTRSSRAGTYSICTVVEEWTHGYFCFGYFFSLTHFDLVIRLAQKAWRQRVPVFAHDLGSRGGNCIRLLANTGLFPSTGDRYLFLLQRRLIPFDDSSPLLLFQFSRAWRQSFVIVFLCVTSEQIVCK